jgi:NADPH-dependent curcumin reductase CurA
MKKSKKSINTFGSWFKNGCISTAVVCLAEGGQFFILNRHPDAMDVLLVGNQMGFVVFQLF